MSYSNQTAVSQTETNSRVKKKRERNTFGLNLKTQEVVDFIETETAKCAVSKTAFFNELLESLKDYPIVLSQAKENSLLSEVDAIKQLLNDDVMKRVPYLADVTRRDPVQMLLYLVERGIESDEQLANIHPPDHHGYCAQRSAGRRRSDAVASSKELDSSAA